MSDASPRTLPAWADWPEPHETGPYTVGIEEEVMLLDELSWALAHRIDSVLPRLPHGLSSSFVPQERVMQVNLPFEAFTNARTGQPD